MLVVIYDTMSQSLQRQSKSDRHTRAVFLAESILAHAGIEGAIGQDSASGGSDGDYRWRVKANPLPQDGPDNTSDIGLRPHIITVSVEWRESGGEKTISLSSVRLISGQRQK